MDFEGGLKKESHGSTSSSLTVVLVTTEIVFSVFNTWLVNCISKEQKYIAVRDGCVDD